MLDVVPPAVVVTSATVVSVGLAVVSAVDSGGGVVSVVLPTMTDVCVNNN